VFLRKWTYLKIRNQTWQKTRTRVQWLPDYLTFLEFWAKNEMDTVALHIVH